MTVTSNTAAPFILLPYQQRWVADQSGIKGCEKSRRVGITWAEASDDVLFSATLKSDGGDNTYYIGYNQDMARDFIEECAAWARHFERAASDVEQDVLKGEGKDGDDILIYVIKFASGNRIVALSSRPANLRGKQGRVVIDEAAFHDDLPGLMKAAVALRMWGGDVRIISTHDGEDNPFNDLLAEIRADKRPGTVHRITFDDAIADGLYRRICLKTGQQWTPASEAEYVATTRAEYGADAEEELDVVPSQGGGAYLTRAVIESCMDPDIPVLRLSMPAAFTLDPEHTRRAEVRDWCEQLIKPHLLAMDPHALSYFGEDFARTGDLTAIVPAQRMPNLTRRSPFMVELRGIPFEQQKEILFYIVDRLPRFQAGAMDARGNGQWLSEVAVQRYGASRIEAVMLSQPWYIEHMPKFKAAFEDRTLLVPKDADVLMDYRAVKMERGIAKVPEGKKDKGSDGHPRHGDVAVATALMIYAESVMEPVPIEFQSTGDRRASLNSFDDQHHIPAASDSGFGSTGQRTTFAGF